MTDATTVSYVIQFFDDILYLHQHFPPAFKVCPFPWGRCLLICFEFCPSLNLTTGIPLRCFPLQGKERLCLWWQLLFVFEFAHSGPTRVPVPTSLLFRVFTVQFGLYFKIPCFVACKVSLFVRSFLWVDSVPLCTFDFDADCAGWLSDLECVGVLFSVSLLLVDVELKRWGIGPSVASICS